MTIESAEGKSLRAEQNEARCLSSEPVAFPEPRTEMPIGGDGLLISWLFMEDCWRWTSCKRMRLVSKERAGKRCGFPRLSKVLPGCQLAAP